MLSPSNTKNPENDSPSSIRGSQSLSSSHISSNGNLCRSNQTGAASSVSTEGRRFLWFPRRPVSHPSVKSRSQKILRRGTCTFFWRNSRPKPSVTQTRAVSVGDISPRPLEEDDKTISELDDKE